MFGTLPMIWWQDGTLLRALEHGATRQEKVEALLATAVQVGAVRAALEALQRIIREPGMAGVDWLVAFGQDVEAWRGDVTTILEQRFISVVQSLPFLQRYAEERAQLALHWMVQGTLGGGYAGRGAG